MSSPAVQGVQKVETRSSVEINDSCNDCCPRFCCFGRKVKKHHHIPRKSGSEDLSVTISKTALQMPPIPVSPPISYGAMPSVK
jgi:hypothetical protein